MLEKLERCLMKTTRKLRAQATVQWSELEVPSPQRVRDLWRQKDLDGCGTQFSAKLPRRGGVMLRLWPKWA